MLHVHVNHGESDKQSMASNNAKSYDRVFVAGAGRGRQRYASALLELDPDRLVRIGRPQLDLQRGSRCWRPAARRTVLYAPTWEDDADYNNYSSVDTIGPQIVQQLLAVPDVRLVYKPHPRVVLSADPGIRAAPPQDRQAGGASRRPRPGAGHVSLTDADILAVMPGCDAMVTDVSSVGLDWLYLRTECPLLIADRHDDPERLRLAAPVSRCADVVDSRNVERPGRACSPPGWSTTSCTWRGSRCATTTSTTSRSATAPRGSSTPYASWPHCATSSAWPGRGGHRDLTPRERWLRNRCPRG